MRPGVSSRGHHPVLLELQFSTQKPQDGMETAENSSIPGAEYMPAAISAVIPFSHPHEKT